MLFLSVENVVSDVTESNVVESNLTKEEDCSVSLQPPVSSFPLIPCTCPISVNELGTYVASCHSDGNAGFSKQHQVNIETVNCSCVSL